VIGAGRGLNGSDRMAVKSVNVATNELKRTLDLSVFQPDLYDGSLVIDIGEHRIG